MKTISFLTLLFCLLFLPHKGFCAGNTSKPAKKTSVEGQEKRIKYKEKSNVNFEDQVIEGSAKNPYGTFLNNKQMGSNSGFLKLREEWHDHLIIDANGLTQ